jgi:hypothetical protein
MPIIEFLKTSDNTYKEVSATNPLPTTATISGGTVTADTELPAAAALADGTANPTTTSVGALVLGFNGTTWDRLQVDASKFLKTVISSALPAGTAVIGHIIRDATTITIAHSVATSGVASTTALAANASRKYALIVNDSANAIYIFLGATAVLNQGIRLNANGGSYEINETNLYTGIITTITTVASQNVIVTEGT